jgi:hypothetical protein
MSVSHDDVARLTSALLAGNTASAESYRRTLARVPVVTAEHLAHLASLEVLEKMRVRIKNLLDECERSGAIAIAELCRDVIRDPLSTFTPLRRWGVCAVSGRTVNLQLQVNANERERAVDAQFGPFLQSLWCLSHCELIEGSRHDGGCDDDLSEVGLDELTASYVQAFAHVTATLEKTHAVLARRRCE